MRHAIFAHGDFDFHAGVVYVAKYFSYFTHGLRIARWLLGQFDTDHLTGFSFTGRAGKHDILANAFVFGCHEPNTVLLHETANDVGIGARDDFNDGALRTTTTVRSGHTCLHAIAMQDFLHFFFGQKNIIAFIGNQKAVAITMT